LALAEKRKVLGKGLDALIPTGIGEEERVQKLSVAGISPNPYQPRQAFDEKELAKLAGSLAEQGLQQPLVVRKTPSGYQLVVGERRLRAAKLIGWKFIPAVVREIDETEVLKLALIENLQREDLNAVEEAKAYSLLAEKFAMTHEQIGELVGKNRTTVTNTIRLLSLPQEIQDMLLARSISPGAARALLSLPSVQEQIETAREIVAFGSTVRDVEEAVKKTSRRERGKKIREVEAQIVALEEELQRKLMTKVKIKYKAGRGSITISFFNDEELERLLQSFKQPVTGSNS
jgi:ParB family chromosome partitioning protein